MRRVLKHYAYKLVYNVILYPRSVVGRRPIYSGRDFFSLRGCRIVFGAVSLYMRKLRKCIQEALVPAYVFGTLDEQAPDAMSGVWKAEHVHRAAVGHPYITISNRSHI